MYRVHARARTRRSAAFLAISSRIVDTTFPPADRSMPRYHRIPGAIPGTIWLTHQMPDHERLYFNSSSSSGIKLETGVAVRELHDRV